MAVLREVCDVVLPRAAQARDERFSILLSKKHMSKDKIIPIFYGAAPMGGQRRQKRGGEQIRHRVGWGFSKRLRPLNSLEVSKHFEAPKLP